MPRSKRRIDTDNRAIERGRKVLKDALRGFSGKPQATVIAQRIQGNAKWSLRVENDKPLLRYLWGEGLKALIRDALAEWGLLSPPGEVPPQLELFAEDERDIVREIGMARIWVPSRGAHVQYHDSPPELLDEASHYYGALGRGALRTSELLQQLSALRRQKPSTKRAA